MASTDPTTLKDELESGDSKQSTADITEFVQNLLMQMQTRFQAMSESILSKNILMNSFGDMHLTLIVDEMGSRIDDLEQSINDLKEEIGPDSGSKVKPEESKHAEGSA